MSQGNLESNGKYCIYSNGVGNLYPVVPISFASGNYNVVDVTRGNSGTQDCCSGDNLPDKTCINGVWIPTAKAECSVLDPCEGNEWRANYGTDNQKIRYECIESKCVAKIVNVDCNKDAGCKSTNLRCNPNTFTCEFASVGVDTPGTPVLSTTETECLKEGNKWIPKTTTKTGLLGGLIPFGGSTEVVEAHCEQSGINWTKIIIIVLIIAFLFFFRNYILAGLKSLRRLLPF